MDGRRFPLTAYSPMGATARDGSARGRRAGPGADGAVVHHLAASNGDVDWQLLELRWCEGQWIIAEHHDVGELPHLDAAEELFLEARIGGVDSLAAQGLRHGERLASRDLLAAEGLVRHRGTEVAQWIHWIIAGRVGPETQGEARVPERAEGEALLGGAALQHLHHRITQEEEKRRVGNGQDAELLCSYHPLRGHHPVPHVLYTVPMVLAWPLD